MALGTPGMQNDQAVSSCNPNLTLTGLNTTSGLNEVEFTINSTEQVGGSATIDYSAGSQICLDPGFEVIIGAVFHAYILGCN